MWMINTCNEWDPLEAIVVGSATAANWPTSDPVFAQEGHKTTWTETPVPSGPVAQTIVDQANRELDILSETLVRRGVMVYRPRPMDFVAEQGMYNYCPRDRLLVWGDTVVDGTTGLVGIRSGSKILNDGNVFQKADSCLPVVIAAYSSHLEITAGRNIQLYS
jgi:hypothetical protein